MMFSFIFCLLLLESKTHRSWDLYISCSWMYSEYLGTGLGVSCGRCSVNICWTNECISKGRNKGKSELTWSLWATWKLFCWDFKRNSFPKVLGLILEPLLLSLSGFPIRMGSKELSNSPPHYTKRRCRCTSASSNDYTHSGDIIIRAFWKPELGEGPHFRVWYKIKTRSRFT